MVARTMPGDARCPARLARRVVALWLVLLFVFAACAAGQSDPLSSWNDGPAKQAILDFVAATTDAASPDFVPPKDRLATFDQDGTTWVEQPMYTPVLYCLDRLKEIAKDKPELAATEPYKTLLAGNLEAIAALPGKDYDALAAATLTGITTEALTASVRAWLATARDVRWHRPYTELVYQPMLEVMRLLRENSYKTYFVTGGPQDFVRAYAESVYAIPPEQVVGTINAVDYGYGPDGKPVLTEAPRLLLETLGPGKAEGIHLRIGRRPNAAFGNTAGDREMLEYTQAGDGKRLMLLVHHDDAVREYAYGAQAKVGTFSEALMSEARQRGWIVISMRQDWKRIFSWEGR